MTRALRKRYGRAKTRLDLILDRVKPREGEVTIDVEELTEDDVQKVIAAAKARGLSVSRTRGHLLIRDLRGVHES